MELGLLRATERYTGAFRVLQALYAMQVRSVPMDTDISLGIIRAIAAAQEAVEAAWAEVSTEIDRFCDRVDALAE